MQKINKFIAEPELARKVNNSINKENLHNFNLQISACMQALTTALMMDCTKMI